MSAGTVSTVSAGTVLTASVGTVSTASAGIVSTASPDTVSAVLADAQPTCQFYDLLVVSSTTPGCVNGMFDSLLF